MTTHHIQHGIQTKRKGKTVFTPFSSYDEAWSALQDWRKDAPDEEAEYAYHTVTYGSLMVVHNARYNPPYVSEEDL